MRKLFRKLNVYSRGTAAVLIFTLEYFPVIWPHLHWLYTKAKIQAWFASRNLPKPTREYNICEAGKKACSYWQCRWAKHICGWSSKVLGYKRIHQLPTSVPDRLIIVSDHRSSLDIPELLNIAYLMERHVAWIPKWGLKWIPGIRFALEEMDCGFVKRDRSAADIERVKICAEKSLASGFSVLVFAGGGRHAGQRPKYPRASGFDQICEVFGQSPNADKIGILVISIRTKATKITTIFELGGVTGNTITFRGKLYTGIVQLPSKERRAWLREVWQEMDQDGWLVDQA